MLHSNSQKRIYNELIYAVTSKTNLNYPYFENEFISKIWVDFLLISKQLFKYKLYAFCLNYDHFHILIEPNNKIANYSKIIHFLKKNTSHNINKILGFTALKFDPNKLNKIKLETSTADKLYSQVNDFVILNPQYNENNYIDNVAKNIANIEGHNSNCRLQYQCNQKFIINRDLINKWIYQMKVIFEKQYGKNHNIPKFKWQRSFHDHYIRNQKDYENHWNYIMTNFQKHNLPKDWNFTGLNFTGIIDD